jgi:hypothetical protein
MQKISKFQDFIGEASLRGNVGIPGEEGSGRESWLDKINRSSDASAQRFALENRADIQNFMGLAMRSQELQRGHEKELAELVEDAIRTVYGTLIDDITLDLKIGDRDEVADSMEETPTEQQAMEEITDEGILDAIQVRKILRTIQQGKGLSVKEVLNSDVMKSGIREILGEDAAEYIRVLNKVSNVAQFFDWTVPEDVQKGAWQTRSGFAGSVQLDFPEEADKDKTDAAENVLKDLENGDDIVNNPDVEELFAGVDTTIKAIGVDVSVLVHETIKGIYMLTVQWSLEALSEEEAEKVIANTDTLFDELQEIKYGRQLQTTVFKIVATNTKVIEAINDLTRNEASDDEIIAFQEQLNFLFFGKLVAIAKEEPKKFLKLMNDILSENDEAVRKCAPIIEETLDDLEQEKQYQREQRGEVGPRSDDYYEDDEEDDEVTYPEEIPGYTGQSTDDLLKADTSRMSKDEIANAIIDAYQRGDTDEAERLRGLLPESFRFPRFEEYQRLLEDRRKH